MGLTYYKLVLSLKMAKCAERNRNVWGMELPFATDIVRAAPRETDSLTVQKRFGCTQPYICLGWATVHPAPRTGELSFVGSLFTRNKLTKI